MRCSVSFIAACAMLASTATAAAVPEIVTSSIPASAVGTEATSLPPSSTQVAVPTEVIASSPASGAPSGGVQTVTVFVCPSAETSVISVETGATAVDGNGGGPAPSATAAPSSKNIVAEKFGQRVNKRADSADSSVVTSLVDGTAVLSSPAEPATATIPPTQISQPTSAGHQCGSAVTVTVTAANCEATQSSSPDGPAESGGIVTVSIPADATALSVTEVPTGTALPDSQVVRPTGFAIKLKAP